MERGYADHGVLGAAGAVAGVGLEIANPLKKLKMLERGAKALEAAGDYEKAAKLRKEAEQLRKEASESGEGGARSTRKKQTRNPCAHLAKGDREGEGSYRGGSYRGAPGSLENEIESHHTPAKSAYPDELADKVGGINRMPSIQMDRDDHRETSSHGWQGADGDIYRQQQRDLMESGHYRDAVAKDLRDVRNIARNEGDPRKYNRAMLESAAYRRCLEKHGLIPRKKGR
ncbi:hypothetical protein [Methylobacterium sp. Leaf469]|uniref:hypothetical protein n=1 Tax=Methylobacterium sp. Leaf469 TaxID=1736387 RepID=UPI0012E3F581|nr:hypothetical protein [Methylobacterium sp. Leaf469]